jgi:transposase
MSVAEQRYEAVRAVIADGETVTLVAARFGVSRKTMHVWLARYEAGGMDALADRSHRPRSCPHQMPAAVEVALVQLRVAHPSWGPRRLSFELARTGVEPAVSESAAYRALVRLNLIDPAALRAYGIPGQILTDNGKVFTGRFNHPPVEVLFDRICRENGIEHLHTQPRSPTTTGKIERFHRAIRTEFRTDRVFASLPAAQAELDEWVTDYNTRRPHQALGMATPAEKFLRSQSAAVTPIRGAAASSRPSEQRTDGTWVARRASAVGVVCVNWQQVCLGVAAAGHNIDVWVTTDVLQFYDGDTRLRTEKRTTHGTPRVKRAQVPGTRHKISNE